MAMIQPAPDLVNELVDEIMREYHPQLHSARVRIDTYMALPDLDKDGEARDRPALSDKGYACLAKIKITSSDDRGKGRGHAEMTIDDERFKELSERQRQALIDHELMHLDVVYDKDDDIVEDKYGMTKLRTRKHDHQYGWFNDVADRWAKDSQEVFQAAHLLKSNSAGWIQIALDFGEEMTDDFPNDEAFQNAMVEQVATAAEKHGMEVINKNASSVRLRTGDGVEMTYNGPQSQS